jgi:type II secretory pathway component GspD/PulD (secretin)
VPFLGDIPYIGGLFRHKSYTTKKTDLVVQITPHILDEKYVGWPKPKSVQEAEDKYFKSEEEGVKQK